MNKAELTRVLHDNLGRTLDKSDFSSLGHKYEGKVRDNYTAGDTRTIIVSDRVSTFDVVVGTVPFKGQVLNRMAHHWFEATAHIAPNHVIRVPDPSAMVVHECTPLKVEFVVRSYLTGVSSTSIWQAYARGERTFCGHKLPGGMRQHEKLPQPLLTPSTKAPKGEHDISVSRDEIIASGAVSADDFDRGAAMAMALFAFGQQRAAERGMILVDTKYELGKRRDGTIVVIDEIHTPDSSRYWYASDYQERMSRGESPRSLDKEFLRRWLIDTHGYRGDGPPPALSDEVRVEAALRYIETFELITGQEFVPNTEPPVARLQRNLGVAS